MLIAAFKIVTSQETGGKSLAVIGDSAGLQGIKQGDQLVCPLSSHNASVMRERLSWLRPRALGLQISAGFGDRLGMATPGHIASVRGTRIAPVFAQQSVRENARTGRTPQQVLDDAMWGVLECQWEEPWGADADHIKTVGDLKAFIDAGYTFYTLDPGDHVDDRADTDDLSTLRSKFAALNWRELAIEPQQLLEQMMRQFDLGPMTLDFDEEKVLRSAVKYGNAVAHAAGMARHLKTQLGSTAFDLEISVDETNSATTVHEHFYVAMELKRLGIEWTSLAPRFVGRFEKGVDYIGDVKEFESDIAGHAAIIRYFGNAYKLSLHTGSDKFSIYPAVARHLGGLVHLKTAGTSYLEGLRVIASFDPSLFRRILDFARSRYEEDRATYHVSGRLEAVPESSELGDSELRELLNLFDARQVLHVTFGSVLGHFGDEIRGVLALNQGTYADVLKGHFDRHLQPFV